MIYLKRKTLLILIFTLSFFPLITLGQLGDISNTFFLSLSPTSPAPLSTFSASVTSSAFKISDSNIRWLVNGSLRLSGVGESLISLTAPGVGESMTIDVSVTPPGGSALSKRIIVRPIGVELLWETDTYTPPFYKGKALYSYRSPIKVVALPRTASSRNISFIPRNNLNYVWTLNGEEIGGLSGFGKNTFEFTPVEITPKNILVGVSVFDSSENLLGSNTIVITERAPEILFYEENPVLGKIFGRAVENNYVLNKDEVLIKAEPYYFTSRDLNNGDLVFNWRLNNEGFEVGGDQTRVIFGKSSGTSLINLSVSNSLRVIQKAFNGFRVINE